jgi:hypothetical protein
VSTKEETRRPEANARGYAWTKLSLEILRRDGAYKGADGRWHGVCRNWLEAKRLGLPAPCPHNGEDEVWACHGQGWTTHPALRLVPENVLALCKHCDPDRNPEVRPYWWGDPKEPVVAGWERGNTWPPKNTHTSTRTLLGLGLLGIAAALAYAVIFANWAPTWLLEASWAAAGAMAFLSSKHRHAWAVFDLGSLLWLALVGLDALARYYWHVGVGASPFHTLLLASAASYAASLILCHLALRRRWLSRSAHTLLHALVRLVHKAKRAP